MELIKQILKRIRAHGPLSFRDFMETALYHPRLGYYMASRDRIGPGGDYYTSCCLGPVFGAMVAKQLAEMWRLSGETEFTIVEFGAGDGRLCADILQYFRDYTELYERLHYVIIEKSPHMRQKEKELLKHKVSWAVDLKSVGPFSGCVLSNELLDNFAVHRVVMKDKLMEVFVDDRDGLAEILLPASARLNDYFDDLNVKLPDGYCTEVNLQAADWLADINQYLKRGFVLTIDYGYSSDELYHPRRSRGTLLCYSRHRLSEQFYENPGGQDITAHVNFTALSRWGDQYGLSCCGLTTQAAFLLALGFKTYLRQQVSAGGDVLQLALQESRLTRTLLIDMGRKFKVMIQQKAMPDVHLTGLNVAGPLV